MKQSNYRVLVKLLFIFVVYSQCFSREWKTIDYISNGYWYANETDKYLFHHGVSRIVFNEKEQEINGFSGIRYPDSYNLAGPSSINKEKDAVFFLFQNESANSFKYKVFKTDFENFKIDEIGFEFINKSFPYNYPILLSDSSVILMRRSKSPNRIYKDIVKFTNKNDVNDSIILNKDNSGLEYYFSYYEKEELMFLGVAGGLVEFNLKDGKFKSLRNPLRTANPENNLIYNWDYRYGVIFGDSLYIYSNSDKDNETGIMFQTIVNRKTYEIISNKTLSTNLDHEKTNLHYLHNGNYMAIVDVFNKRFIWSNNKGETWSNFEDLPQEVNNKITFEYYSFLSSNGILFLMNSSNVLGINGTENYYTRLSPSSSIYEQDDDISMLFPNPAPDYINIGGVGSYEIYSMIGEKISTGESFNGKLNVTELPKGIYFVSINGKVSKFVKE